MPELVNDGHPFTTAQAPTLGLTPKMLRLRLTQGLVRRVFRNVYVDASVPDSRAGRVRALALATPANAIVSDETAAWVHGLDVFAPGRRHDLTPSMLVRHGKGRVEHTGSNGRQAIIAPGDVEFVDGLFVTTALRTTSDLLRRMYRPYALAAADAFAHAGLIDRYELIDYVEHLKGFRGIVQARSLAAIVEPKTQSAGESWQRLRILDAGLPPPDPQHEVIDDFGRSYFIDLPYPDVLVGTEYDGREFHTNDEHRRHDQARRDYLTEVYGWRWIIGTRDRIFGDDTSFEHELGRALGLTPLSRWWGTGRSGLPRGATSAS
ncbi:type IV toxin-antitoxin system AbiEi family antitoxin domain-containing protein [Aeromicrobium sp. UC242_57]|uniref:type IV toxin-antitoxin system AbiEi family antitoxin domain-containing protein n=1 Tax=Aeromicrobium sp. UC242_57 TaxID=3374624 RepID=UPI003787CC01